MAQDRSDGGVFYPAISVSKHFREKFMMCCICISEYSSAALRSALPQFCFVHTEHSFCCSVQKWWDLV